MEDKSTARRECDTPENERGFKFDYNKFQNSCKIEYTTFQKGLEELINKHCIENVSNTPDFILAEYLVDCMKAFNYGVAIRDAWHNNDSKDFMGNPVTLEK